MSRERFEDVVGGHSVAMTCASDETELHVGVGVADREELFVSFFVDDERCHSAIRSRVEEHRSGECAIENFDGDVMDTTTVLGQIRGNLRAGLRADEDDDHSTGCDRRDSR